MTIITIAHYIAGQRVMGESARTQPVFNPATAEQTGEVKLTSKADVDSAVAAVRSAPGGRYAS